MCGCVLKRVDERERERKKERDRKRMKERERERERDTIKRIQNRNLYNS